MGGASSKPARQFPRTAKPGWAGARTPTPEALKSPIPRASESRTEAIEQDARDPHFMANLGRLGQVKVDHHMQTVRPDADRIQRAFQTRLQSEEEAKSSRITHNRLLASSLQELLQERKSATTQAEVSALASRYGIDPGRLESLAKAVNSPSVEEGSVMKQVDEDGIETYTMRAAWVSPQIRPA